MELAEIRDTPGYFYAIAYWLAVFLIYYPFRGKGKHILAHVAGSAGVLAFLLVFMEVTKGARKDLFILSMACIYCVIFVYVRFLFGCSWTEAGYFSAEAVMTGEYMASLSWQLCYYLAVRVVGRLTIRLEILCMLGVYTACITAGILLKRRYLKDGTDAVITLRDTVVIWVSVLSIISISNLSYITSNSPFSSTNAWEIFMLRTMADACGVILIIAYRSQAREMQTRLERDALHSINEMQYRTYRLSRESIDMVNQKYHDLKHQIVLLREEAGSARSKEYLDQMEQEIRIYEDQNKTGNRVLDVVLTAKSAHCRAKDIELKVIADGSLLSFMDDMEISALFGNMLDNAIENAEKQPDHEKRLISLYVTREKGFLLIRMQNYCDEKLKFKNGMPVTTKADHHLHGYGMKSMQKTVQKYNGSVVAAQENNWFVLRILIPLKEVPDPHTGKEKGTP